MTAKLKGQNSKGGLQPTGGGTPARLVDSPGLEVEDPLEFYRAMAKDKNVDIRLRYDAMKQVERILAINAGAPAKPEGKKAEQKAAALEVSQGGFAARPAPKLQAVK